MIGTRGLGSGLAPPAGTSARLVFALALSGCAALVYEVSWIQRAALIFGSTTQAVATVLAVFFLGLALGSEAFGRLAQRTPRPLRVFVIVEVALAALALASPLAFRAIEELYTPVYRALRGEAAVLLAVRALLVSAVLLPPCLLMGASLPLASRVVVRSDERAGAVLGALYAVNTLGGAAGAALAGFALIPSLGIRGAILCGCALSALAAAVVATLRAESGGRPAPPATRLSAPGSALVGVLFFGTGAVALGAEVLWTRFLPLVLRTDVYTASIVLSVTLVGMVVGSALAGAIADRSGARAVAFGAVSAAHGLVLLAVMQLPPAAWAALGGTPWTFALLLLPPAALSGAAFPLAVRMVLARADLAGLAVGRMSAFNTLGGIAGPLLVGFAALPVLGIATSLRVLSATAIAIGAIAWLRLTDLRPPAQVALVAGAALAWLQLPVWLDTRLPADFLGHRGTLLAFREGMTANVAALRHPQGTALEIDGWWQGGSWKSHQIMAAHVPALLHPAPRRVLVVGAGTGQTASRFLLHDVERVDVVDLEPAVFALVRDWFDARWMDDPRVRLLREDGRSYLLHTGERYDVVSLEPGQLFRPGVPGFYTVDFYERARARLQPGGLLCQFVPLPFLSVAELRDLVASFIEVFPQSVLWYNTAELLLIGQNADALALDAGRLARLPADGAVRRDLAYSPWGGDALARPEVFLGGFLMGPDGLAAFARGGEAYRDDPARLAYETAELDPAATREIDAVAALRPFLEPVHEVLDVPAEVTRPRVAAVRQANLAEIHASALVRRSGALPLGLGELRAVLREALEASPTHPEAHRMLGDVDAAQGRFPEAEAHYRRTLSARPGDVLAQAGLGHALVRTGRYSEALEVYRTVLELTPNDASAHSNMGAVYAALGQHAAARRAFERALELDPQHADAARNLARIEALAPR